MKNDGNFLFTFLKTFTGSFTTYRHSIYLYLFPGFTCNLLQLQTLLEKKKFILLTRLGRQKGQPSTKTIQFFNLNSLSLSVYLTLLNSSLIQLMRRERPPPIICLTYNLSLHQPAQSSQSLPAQSCQLFTDTTSHTNLSDPTFPRIYFVNDG